MRLILTVTTQTHLYIMGTERTYVFGGDGGGSKLDVTAMLPGLCGYRGVDPNVRGMPERPTRKATAGDSPKR